MATLQFHEPSVIQFDVTDGLALVAVNEPLPDGTVGPEAGKGAHADTDGHHATDDGGRTAHHGPGDQHLPLAPRAELIAIAPRRHLGALRLTNADEIHALTQPREADIVRAHAQPRIAKAPLHGLNRFPALVQRREVPTRAGATDDPQTPAPRIERETGAHGKAFEGLVLAERLGAVNAGREHDRG